jgi:transposase-like protein
MTTPDRPDLIEEVARRIDHGEPMTKLAREYGVTRVTIWRWNNEALRNTIPSLEDRDAWRNDIAATYADRIRNAQETGDDAALVALTSGLRKMLGLDHADLINEGRLRLEARKLDLLSEALFKAAENAGIPEADRIRLGHHLDEALAELEEARR